MRWRLALLVDAAHVGAPATGAGFRTGLFDAQALARALGAPADSDEIRLRRYELSRLRPAQQLATQSMQWSAEYLRSVGH